MVQERDSNTGTVTRDIPQMRCEPMIGREIEPYLRTALGAGKITRNLRGGGDSDLVFKYVREVDQGDCFIKVINRKDEDLTTKYKHEFLGLKHMAETKSIRVPQPLYEGLVTDHSPAFAWIAMEFVPLGGSTDDAAFGRDLAKMHRHNVDTNAVKMYGLECDGRCGLAYQPNGWMNDWCDFYRERRLVFQHDLIGKYTGKTDTPITRALKPLLDGTNEVLDHLLRKQVDVATSLIHGDLWSGNWSTCDSDNRPVIFDPAAYFAHNEAEFSIMTMFGSPSHEFWEAYNEAGGGVVRWDGPGWRQRRALYQLYHYLNHHNIFGGYESGVNACLRALGES
eukprot:Clim_evm4s217 gene=Clim_evmTU4s217